SKMRLGVGSAGTIALVTGIACVAQSIGAQVDALAYENVDLPLMRMAMELQTIYSQIKAGEQVDLTELAFYARQFYQKAEPATGEKQAVPSSSWTDAKDVQSEMGKTPNGLDP